jgi:hypothetical protein
VVTVEIEFVPLVPSIVSVVSALATAPPRHDKPIAVAVSTAAALTAHSSWGRQAGDLDREHVRNDMVIPSRKDALHRGPNSNRNHMIEQKRTQLFSHNIFCLSSSGLWAVFEHFLSPAPKNHKTEPSRERRIIVFGLLAHNYPI